MTNTYKLSYFVTILCLVLGGGVDGRLNPVFGHLFTKDYCKMKTGFCFTFSSLTFQAFIIYFILVTYNFEQVVVSRNYFSNNISERTYYFLYLKLVNAVDFTSKRSHYLPVLKWDRGYLIGVRGSHLRCFIKKLYLEILHRKTSVLC